MSSWLSAVTIGVQTFLPEALYYPQAMLNIRLPTVWITDFATNPSKNSIAYVTIFLSDGFPIFGPP